MRVMAILFLLIGIAFAVYRYMEPNELGPFTPLSVAFVLMSAFFWWMRKAAD